MEIRLSKAALLVFLLSSMTTANNQCPQVESQVDVDLDSFLTVFIQHKRETALMQIDELVDILLKSQCVCKNSCLNGGTRRELPDGGYTCDCACRFTGIICETELSTTYVTITNATKADMATTNILTTDTTTMNVPTTDATTTGATTMNVPTTDATTTDATTTSVPTTNTMTTDVTTIMATTSVTTPGPTECREYADFTELYTGNQSRTFANKACQRWDSQIPHIHTHTDAGKYDGNITNVSQAENYCRNPDNKTGGPWCFTTDANKSWEYCHIPFCPGIACQQTRSAAEYTGTINRVGKHHCLRWDDVQHKFTPANFSGGITNLSQAENYCRNPDPDNNKDGPWCYIKITTEISRKRCKVPFCQGCSLGWTVPSEDIHYEGTTSTTLSGLTCQRWDSQSPHSHSATNPAAFFVVPKYKEMHVAENYCRIVKGFYHYIHGYEPWCYTTATGTKRDWCDIPKCHK